MRLVTRLLKDRVLGCMGQILQQVSYRVRWSMMVVSDMKLIEVGNMAESIKPYRKYNPLNNLTMLK